MVNWKIYFLNDMNEAWRDEVLLALNQACSQDPALIKEAEKKLKAWETEAGFYSLLMVRVRAMSHVYTVLKSLSFIFVMWYVLKSATSLENLWESSLFQLKVFASVLHVGITGRHYSRLRMSKVPSHLHPSTCTSIRTNRNVHPQGDASQVSKQKIK